MRNNINEHFRTKWINESIQLQDMSIHVLIMKTITIHLWLSSQYFKKKRKEKKISNRLEKFASNLCILPTLYLPPNWSKKQIIQKFLYTVCASSLSCSTTHAGSWLHPAQLAAVCGRVAPWLELAEHVDHHADPVLQPPLPLQRPRRDGHGAQDLHQQQHRHHRPRHRHRPRCCHRHWYISDRN